MEITATTAKYAFILFSVGGAAAGLNLAVMELTDPPAGESSEEVTSAAGSDTVTSDTGEPMQVVVDVPVVVPDEVAAAVLAQQAVDVGSAPELDGSLVPIGAAIPAVPAVPTSDTDTAAATAATTAAPVAPVATVPAKTIKSSAADASSPSTTTAASETTTTTAAPRAASQASRDETTTTRAPSTTRATTTTTRAPSTTRATTTTRAPSTTETTTTTQAPSTTAAVAATQYLYYEFPGVASQIIIAQHGDGTLEFWSVTPESGWGYYVEEDGPREIELEFEGDGDDEAEWKLKYDDGELRVKRER